MDARPRITPRPPLATPAAKPRTSPPRTSKDRQAAAPDPTPRAATLPTYPTTYHLPRPAGSHLPAGLVVIWGSTCHTTAPRPAPQLAPPAALRQHRRA